MPGPVQFDDFMAEIPSLLPYKSIVRVQVVEIVDHRSPLRETTPSQIGYKPHHAHPVTASSEMSRAVQVCVQVLEILDLRSQLRETSPSQIGHEPELLPPPSNLSGQQLPGYQQIPRHILAFEVPVSHQCQVSLLSVAGNLKVRWLLLWAVMFGLFFCP